MFDFTSTVDTIESLSFLFRPTLNPTAPKCKRCNTLLIQQFDFTNNEEDVNIFWECPKCNALVRETAEF